MSSFFPWHSGYNTRPRATATRTSVGVEVGVNLPAHRLDSKYCTTGRMVPIGRSKWLMAWYKCTCGGTSGVGCAIPVWRSSMPCSGVPPLFVPVRFVVVRSLLPKVHLYGSHAPLPENKRLSSFLMVHTEKRACAPLRGYRNRPDGGRSQQWEPRLPVIRDHYHCSGFATLHVLEHYGYHLWWRETETETRIR